MSVEDKFALGVLGIIAVVVAVAAYKVNKVLNDAGVKETVAGVTNSVKQTVQSGQDIVTSLGSGYAPPTGSTGSQNTEETAPLGYLESVHDIIAHPYDSFKVLFHVGGY